MGAQRFKGKVAVVTGGNSGIGLGVAKAYAQEGAHVAITGRNEKTLEAAAKEIGDGTLAIQSDAGKVAEIEAAMKKINERFGRIDALFVNAGVAKLVPFDRVTEELFDETVDINMKGVFFTVQKAIPLMSKGSAIVLNASINAHLGMPGDYGLWRDQSGRYQHVEDALGRAPGKRYSRECRQPRTDHLSASARWTPGNNPTN
jgi:NAD(P)-dependent dehydrogenase (short-subunit alcohol dehydrogenase family)